MITYKEFLEDIKKQWEWRKQKELDYVIVIFGPEGSGKSISALAIAKALKETGQNFDVIHNVVYHAPQLVKIFGKEKQTIIVDEALNLMYSKEHMGNSLIAKQLFTGRFLQNVLLIVVQNLRWLDPVIRDHRARGFLLTTYDPEEDRYKWLFFSGSKGPILYKINKIWGYYKMEKFYGLRPDVIDATGVIDYVKEYLEQYKLVKRAEDVINALLLALGVSERKFEQALAKKIFKSKDNPEFFIKRKLKSLVNGSEEAKSYIEQVTGRRITQEIINIIRKRYFDSISSDQQVVAKNA